MIRQFGDVAAMEFNGEGVEQRVIGLDAIPVLLQRSAHLGPMAGSDGDDDLLGRSAGTERIPHAAIDVRVRRRSSKSRGADEPEAQQKGSGQTAYDVHDSL